MSIAQPFLGYGQASTPPPPTVWVARGGIAAANGGNGIASNAGVTLLIDGSGNVFKSTDGGVTWTSATAIPDIGSLNGTLTVSSTGTWIWAGSAQNPFVVWRSTDDGTTWTSHAVATVAGGNGGVTVTDNAGNWTLQSNAVGFGNNVARSVDDGVTWTNQQTLSEVTSSGGVWDGTNFEYVTGAAPGAIVTTPDGVTWTIHTATTDLTSLAYNSSGPAYITGIGTTNAVRVSSTAIGLATATDQPIAGLDSGGLFLVFFADDIFFAFDLVGGVASSTDNGATWTIGTLNFPPSDLAVWAAFDSVHGNFIALSSGGYVSTLTV